MGSMYRNNKKYSSGSTVAKSILFDNTNSKMNVNNVQDAIDEMYDDVSSLTTSVNDKSIISDAYNPSKSYNVGEYCINNNKLYECTTATSGEFNSGHWTVRSVSEKISELNKNLNSLFKIWNSDITADEYGRYSLPAELIDKPLLVTTFTPHENGKYVSCFVRKFRLNDVWGTDVVMYDCGGNEPTLYKNKTGNLYIVYIEF